MNFLKNLNYLCILKSHLKFRKKKFRLKMGNSQSLQHDELTESKKVVLKEEENDSLAISNQIHHETTDFVEVVNSIDTKKDYDALGERNKNKKVPSEELEIQELTQENENHHPMLTRSKTNSSRSKSRSSSGQSCIGCDHY